MLGRLLMTNDTVVLETPALSATAEMDIRCSSIEGVFFARYKCGVKTESIVNVAIVPDTSHFVVRYRNQVASFCHNLLYPAQRDYKPYLVNINFNLFNISRLD